MDFPSDIPLHAGAQVLEVDQTDGGVSATLKSADAKKSVTRAYAESLTAAGWKISAQRDTPTGETLIFADKASPRRSISVMLTPDGNGTRVVLMEMVH